MGGGGSITFGEPGALTGTSGTSALLSNFPGSFVQINGTVTGTGTAHTIECILKEKGTTALTTIVQVLNWGNTSPFFRFLFITGKLQAGTVTTGEHLVANQFNHLLQTVTGTTVKLYLNGVLIGTGSRASGAISSTNFEVILNTYAFYFQEVAAYNVCLTATQAKTHYQLFATGVQPNPSGKQIKVLMTSSGIPASAIGTIATGKVTCKAPLITLGQTQLLSVIQTAENTENGFFYCAETGKITYLDGQYFEKAPAAITSNCTIADDTTPAHFPPAVPPTPGLDDLTLWNYIPVGIQGATATSPTSALLIAQTSTSQTKYGKRVLTGYTGMYFTTRQNAQARATLLKIVYSTPMVRIRQVSINSRATAGTNFPQMLGRKLLDAITVHWLPFDGTASAFVQLSNIEKITHTVTKSTWTTTWGLAPVFQRTWFVLNNATRGVLAGTGSSAKNVLGF